MIKKSISIAIAAGLITTSAISFANETADQQLPTIQAPTVQAPTVRFNPASPATYMGFINPASHQAYHKTMVNPVQWGQFMQPQFFMQMADPSQMAQWMNPASYQVMMNPATYMYWMQPNVVMGEMASAPTNAATMMNPAGYMNFMNPATYGAWTNMFQPAPQVIPPKDEG